jgi:hypothetical protein
MSFFDFLPIIGPALDNIFEGDRNDDNIAATERNNQRNIDLAKETNAQQLLLNRENQALQREFAKNGIRWRAEDAQAAGMHPLYALGGSGASYSPGSVNLMTPQTNAYIKNTQSDTFSKMGQGLTTALARQQTMEERERHQANMAVMRASVSKDEAMARYYDSEAARARQAPSAPMDSGVQTFPVSDRRVYSDQERMGLSKADRINVKPDTVVSSRKADPSLTAGIHAGLREYVMGYDSKGRPLRAMLPWSEEGPAEALESTPYWLYPRLIQQNTQKYGKDWLSEFIALRPATVPGKESLDNTIGRAYNSIKRWWDTTDRKLNRSRAREQYLYERR